jgi:hypothetical protein
MTTKIIERLTQTGRLRHVDSASGAVICSLLQVIEVIAEEGATAIVKLDGERSTDRHTVILSGGPLRAEFYRGDGDDLRTLLEQAVAFYDEKVWKKERQSD